MGAGVEDRTPLVAPTAPSPPTQPHPLLQTPLAGHPSPWGVQAGEGKPAQAAVGGSIPWLQAGRKTPGTSLYWGGHGRAEGRPGAPGSRCQEGNRERGFAANGRRDMMERGGCHWPCNLDRGWSREGGRWQHGWNLWGWRWRGKVAGQRGEKVAAGWCLVRVSGVGKCRGSLWCWGGAQR